jgi:hypothetical protein
MNMRLVLFSVLSLGLVSIGLVSLRPSSAAETAPKLLIFYEENFQGPSLELSGSLLDLGLIADGNGVEFDWNDHVKSVIVVSGAWRLAQHGRGNTEIDDTPLELLDLRTKRRVPGWSCLLSATSTGPLEIPRAALGGFAPDVSSIELVSEKNLEDWALPRVAELR